MKLKNMRECDNSKIHISNNSLLSICLLIICKTLTSHDHPERLVASLTLSQLETGSRDRQLTFTSVERRR